MCGLWYIRLTEVAVPFRYMCNRCRVRFSLLVTASPRRGHCVCTCRVLHYYDVRLLRSVTERTRLFTIIVFMNYVCIYAQWRMKFDICDDKKYIHIIIFKLWIMLFLYRNCLKCNLSIVNAMRLVDRVASPGICWLSSPSRRRAAADSDSCSRRPRWT